MPVNQEVTLAVMSERVSDLGVGVGWGSWKPSPGSRVNERGVKAHPV